MKFPDFCLFFSECYFFPFTIFIGWLKLKILHRNHWVANHFKEVWECCFKQKEENITEVSVL